MTRKASGTEGIVEVLTRLNLIPSDNEIAVAGAVTLSTRIRTRHQITVSEAIAYGGGLKRSSAAEIKILRKDPATGYYVKTAVNHKEIRRGEIADPILQSGEIVFVPPLTKISPLKNLLFPDIPVTPPLRPNIT